MLTNLFDITGFFVSVLINLLLIALICYYFKRKIDNLEISQSEQAKTLYALLSQQNSMSQESDSKNVIMNNIMDGIEMSQMVQSSHDDHEHDDNSDNESESESEEEDEGGEREEEEDDNIEGVLDENTEQLEMVEQNNGVVVVEKQDMMEEDNIMEEDNMMEEDNTVKSLHINEIPESDVVEEQGYGGETYEKMTVKELRTVLAQKGVHAKSSMNKSDIINILKGSADIEFEENDKEME